MNLWQSQMQRLAQKEEPPVIPKSKTVVPVKKAIPVKKTQPKEVAKRGKASTNKR